MREMLDVMALRAGAAAIDRSPYRPADLVAAAIERMRPVAAEKALVLDGLVGEVGEVVCDRVRVEEVIAQLLMNAIEASPPRQSISVRAERRESFVVIAVSDRGRGIDVQEWPYIFEGVWEAPSKRGGEKGSGLGLALCSAAVRAHGGEIWVESRLGEGTTFFFTLPARRAMGSGERPAVTER
jgi:signal transduction histidine kinase